MAVDHTVTMSSSLKSFFINLTIFTFLLYSISSGVVLPDTELHTYIIQVEQPSTKIYDIESWHRSFLPQSSSLDTLIHSYTEVFNGFSAKLTNQELEHIKSSPGFIRAFPSKNITFHTTHTPDFLKLTGPTGLWNTSSNLGKGIIIGLVDTGISPYHPSFRGENMPPPPKKWKGKCGFEDKSLCNNKLIGARYFGAQIQNPIDVDGHGSHTSSIAAGNFVKHVNFFGLGSGTMSGIAPQAHLAMYKVGNYRSTSHDIIAAVDAAVKDGVDVLSVSMGRHSETYDSDPIAIAAFGAVKRGVIVVCSGSNAGPDTSSISNDAPWIMTVAASSIDRNFRSTVKLGNGKEYYGEALYQPSSYTSIPFPLVFKDERCGLDDNKGKIAVCPVNVDSSNEIDEGIILINPKGVQYTIDLSPRAFPCSEVTWKDGLEIMSYVKSNSTPTATILFNHTVVGVSPSRVITYFSSRGPSKRSPYVLKPDVCAPGLNIIAASHYIVEGSGTKFPVNVESGTSMAAPHVSGVAAILKSVHPDWSPAAIRSAIMTSSYYGDSDKGDRILDERHQIASFFASGAGFINPPKAVAPGLVYDLGVDDYCGYLCGKFGQKRAYTIGCTDCSKVSVVKEWELNYPSITLPLSSNRVIVVNRTVTNVGNANAKYVAKVDVPKYAQVMVNPKVMKFRKVKEKQSFSVSVRTNKGFEGSLKWICGNVVVRSPLIVLG